MAGNSKRRGAVRKGGKGPTVGSGGNRRRALEGKGPTPKAEDRVSHPAHDRKVARERAAAKAERDARSRAGMRKGGSARPGARSSARPGAAGQRRRAGTGAEYVAGRNSVVEALRAGVPATGLYLQDTVESDARVREAVRAASDAGMPVLPVAKHDLDRLTDGAVHQGVALQIPPYAYADPADLLHGRRRDDVLVVALDGITDPRNLGAVVRSAGAFGAAGVVVPSRRSVGMTAGAWKSSAGAAVRVPVARAGNLTRTLQDYQKAGLMVVGLDAHGEVDLPELDVSGTGVVLVVGAEGEGLSRLVRETCDVVVSIPMAAATESLNAGVAAGIVLYAVAQQR
ncbi:23S rRNA (guanosine(2251)-2'-O)-methyltransferase RlmB [Aquipuribacter nitratireducens]|uniref:23S rRNA (Guanosine(2251)-2'-O)-methyltransferase RlmB n=1 Tax=Aquipuribacter nitratireducens TaxID=650104 RepID=A0ABW0GRW0_9MICO